MNPPARFEFIVDEKYENEKGVFTVMSIEKEKMFIRWADGEAVETSVEFQGRIQERRSYEKAKKEAGAAAAKPVRARAKSAKSKE
jgi:hypothetical protein